MDALTLEVVQSVDCKRRKLECLFPEVTSVNCQSASGYIQDEIVWFVDRLVVERESIGYSPAVKFP